MGILSIVGSLVCCGPFAIVFSIIGLSRAKSSMRLYRENPEAFSGYESVNTGRILSYIGLALSLVMLVLIILYFGAIIAIITASNYSDF